MSSKGIPYCIAGVSAGALAVSPMLTAFGAHDFHALSWFSYALLAPWFLGFLFIPYAGHWSAYPWAICAAFLTWFSLAASIVALFRSHVPGWRWRFSAYMGTFLVMYGFGAWFLYRVWHAP